MYQALWRRLSSPRAAVRGEERAENASILSEHLARRVHRVRSPRRPLIRPVPGLRRGALVIWGVMLRRQDGYLHDCRSISERAYALQY